MALPALPASSLSEVWGLLSPSTVLAALAVLLAAWFLLPLLRPKKPKVKDSGSPVSPLTRTASQFKLLPGEANGRDPNLEGTFVPSTGLLYASPPEPFPFENDHCLGVFLPMHRPTWNKQLDKSGDYPYGDHFKGRKRLWEMRLQMRFKKDITEPLRFGIELEEYVPLNAATKKMMNITVAALRQVCGSDLYHSPGDDPKKVPAPHEKPVFTMPLWAFDQFIVTPEGEEPPDLTDPAFSAFGHKRTDDRGAFIREISALDLRVGPTYTFSFWGISQFLDDIKWEVQKVIPFKSIDFNLFCGKPPVHVVLYVLKDGPDGEKRHLQSRKDYIFRLAFWSSKKPPSAERIRELIPSKDNNDKPAQISKRSKGWKLGSIFACCVTPQRSS